MLNIKEYIRCPYCLRRLSFAGAGCSCSECGKIFPVVAGIPDLRVPIENDWINLEEDRLFAENLSEKGELDWL